MKHYFSLTLVCLFLAIFAFADSTIAPLPALELAPTVKPETQNEAEVDEQSVDTVEDGSLQLNGKFSDDPDKIEPELVDSDGDEVGDNADAFRKDPNEWIDSDGDGIGDNSDWLPTIYSPKWLWFCGAFILFVLLHSWLNLVMDFPEETAESPESVDDSSASPQEMPSPVPAHEISDELAAELGLQVWRLQKRITELPLDEHPKFQRRLSDSIEKFNEILIRNNITIHDFQNDIFMDGSFDLEVKGWEYLTEDSIPEGVGQKPFVLRTIRPVIRCKGKLISKAHIIVGEYKGEEA